MMHLELDFPACVIFQKRELSKIRLLFLPDQSLVVVDLSVVVGLYGTTKTHFDVIR